MKDRNDKNCFGKYTFEDMECMQCSVESACSIEKDNKEREYKRSIKDSKCYDCSSILRCSNKIKKCIAQLNRKCDYKYKCMNVCEKFSFLELPVICTKTILMKTDYKPYLFMEGESYILYCTDDGMLSASKFMMDVLLGRTKPFKEGEIFNKYFKEVWY